MEHGGVAVVEVPQALRVLEIEHAPTSLVDVYGDQELALPGFAGPTTLKDLLAECPVPKTDSRMTAEAINKVAANILSTANVEIAEEYTHLVPSDREQTFPREDHAASRRESQSEVIRQAKRTVTSEKSLSVASKSTQSLVAESQPVKAITQDEQSGVAERQVLTYEQQAQEAITEAITSAPVLRVEQADALQVEKELPIVAVPVEQLPTIRAAYTPVVEELLLVVPEVPAVKVVQDKNTFRPKSVVSETVIEREPAEDAAYPERNHSHVTEDAGNAAERGEYHDYMLPDPVDYVPASPDVLFVSEESTLDRFVRAPFEVGHTEPVFVQEQPVELLAPETMKFKPVTTVESNDSESELTFSVQHEWLVEVVNMEPQETYNTFVESLAELATVSPEEDIMTSRTEGIEHHALVAETQETTEARVVAQEIATSLRSLQPEQQEAVVPTVRSIAEAVQEVRLLQASEGAASPELTIAQDRLVELVTELFEALSIEHDEEKIQQFVQFVLQPTFMRAPATRPEELDLEHMGTHEVKRHFPMIKHDDAADLLPTLLGVFALFRASPGLHRDILSRQIA